MSRNSSFSLLRFIAGAIFITISIVCTSKSADATELIESKHHNFQIENYAKIPGIPWGLSFLPDGRLLVTEREGRLRIIDLNGSVSDPINGIPEVIAKGQGGLLDVAIHPEYEKNGWVYVSYSQALSDETSFTSIARGKIIN